MILNFVINETYLIAHTLFSMSSDRFSSQKNKENIVAFQNFAWYKSNKLYDFLIARFYPEMWLDDESVKLAQELPNYIEGLKQSAQFKKLLAQTKDYLKNCKKQWKTNYKTTVSMMGGLTGLNFDKDFTVFITHPSLKNGCYLGDNRIAWGHNEDWSNYTTVYLWHEILHSYFSNSDRDHSIISFLTDEELRVRLNGDKYPPFVTHKELHAFMEEVLPEWQQYVAQEEKNIEVFRKNLIKRYGNKVV